jgi:TPP-dependent pyruvate/acetoin dehydrogenase alpha subunit
LLVHAAGAAALTLAVEMTLPIVFVVEDNGYGISTPTRDQLPMRLGVFATEYASMIRTDQHNYRERR